MTTLSSKISGMDLWAYDIARRPDKNKYPIMLDGYTLINKQHDTINPVTQNPTESLNQPINQFRVICDIHHTSNGNPILTHGITWTANGNIDQQISTNDYASNLRYNNAMFTGDDVYIQPKGTNITRNVNKEPFTTETPGIAILYQTGIVQYNRGFSVVVFEVKNNYKIPINTIITATPTTQSFSGSMHKGTPETFQVKYEITPGIYEITLTADSNTDWFKCDIDFATKQDVSNLPHSKVTFDLTNCTVTPNDTNVLNGNHSWTFTADNGYIFNEPGGILNLNTGKTGNEISATNTNVTYLNNYNVQNDITIKLVANKQQDTTIPIVQKLTHAQSNVTSASISRKLNAINLTTDTGYTFQSDIQILFYSGGKVISEYNVDGDNKTNIVIPLNTTKENTITENMDNIQLTAVATLLTLHDGYEHNYLVTNTELNSLSNTNIWNYLGDAGGTTMYNVSQYISNLIELPFSVNTTTTVNAISVGKIHTKVVSHETKSRLVTLDLGVINIPSKYNNAYDYQTQTIKLYVPFVPPITIEPANAINQTIHIVYKVDVSNGNLTINLYNDNILFFTGTNNIASQIPFLNAVKNTIINHNTHFNDNDIRQPYVIITRETPILNSDYYPTSERGLIKSYNGNIKVRLLNNMNIPNDELAELTNQLESGVKYVKSN